MSKNTASLLKKGAKKMKRQFRVSRLRKEERAACADADVAEASVLSRAKQHAGLIVRQSAFDRTF